MKKTKTLWCCLALVGFALLVVGCGSSGGGTTESSSGGSTESEGGSGGGEPIKLGTSFPLSGPVGAACKPYSEGAVAWFEHLNAEGGVEGHKIEDNVLDDGYTAPEALANARQFEEEEVLAIFNGCGTIQPPAIQPVAAREGIPYLFPFGALAELIEPVQENFFALLPLFSQQSEGLIEAAFEKEGPGSVYVFNVEVPGSEETLEAIEAATKANGGTFVGQSTQAPGQTDYTPAVLKMKAQHPDYVLLAETAADSVRIVQTIAEQNAMPGKKFLGTTSEANSEFLNPVGGMVEGKFLAASPVLPPSAPDAKVCDEAFKEAKLEASIGALWGCGVAQALVSGIEDTGGELSREALIEAIGSWSKKEASEVLPPITFTPGNHLGVSSMSLLGVKGEEFVAEGELPIK